MRLKFGDRLYTGAVVSQEFADTYNSLSERIESFAVPPENLLNGRHNLFAAYAVANRKESKS